MTGSTEQTNNRLDQILAAIDGIRHDVDGIRHDVDGIRHDVDGIRHDVDGIRHDVDGIRHDVAATNERLTVVITDQARRWGVQETENRVILERIDTYQKSTAQVVNLAFALIGAATVALIGIVLRLAVNL